MISRCWKIITWHRLSYWWETRAWTSWGTISLKTIAKWERSLLRWCLPPIWQIMLKGWMCWNRSPKKLIWGTRDPTRIISIIRLKSRYAAKAKSFCWGKPCTQQILLILAESGRFAKSGPTCFSESSFLKATQRAPWTFLYLCFAIKRRLTSRLVKSISLLSLLSQRSKSSESFLDPRIDLTMDRIQISYSARQLQSLNSWLLNWRQTFRYGTVWEMYSSNTKKRSSNARQLRLRTRLHVLRPTQTSIQTFSATRITSGEKNYCKVTATTTIRLHSYLKLSDLLRLLE